MRKNKGFTLIELLVVIAIIGILASVVLASLNSARNKGADASIKANLNNMRAQAELIYDSAVPNSYATVCADTNNIQKAMTAAATSFGGGATITVAFATAGTATSVACQSQAAGWAIESPLKAGGYWCVDNTGTSIARTSVLAASTAVCPAS